MVTQVSSARRGISLVSHFLSTYNYLNVIDFRQE
jgi:hypothetical protein